MKPIRSAILLPFLVLFLFSSCSDHRVKKEYWPDGSLKSEISMKNDSIYDGKAVWYNENGQKELECYYRDNSIDSVLRRYFPDGRIKEEIHYRMGKENGMKTEWSPDGVKIFESLYAEGLRDGPSHEYYLNGRTRVEGAFRKGLFDGQWYYYDEEGNIVGEGSFSGGTGIQKAYFPNGKTMRIVHYVNNLKEGEEIQYLEDGKIEKINFYEAGKLTGSKQPDIVRKK